MDDRAGHAGIADLTASLRAEGLTYRDIAARVGLSPTHCRRLVAAVDPILVRRRFDRRRKHVYTVEARARRRKIVAGRANRRRRLVASHEDLILVTIGRRLDGWTWARCVAAAPPTPGVSLRRGVREYLSWPGVESDVVGADVARAEIAGRVFPVSGLIPVIFTES